MVTRGINHWGDITVVVIYFIGVLAVGMWSVCRKSRGSVNSYFLAGRSMSWFPVGASLFSSNIGSEHFVGLAGTGAAAGIAMVAYEWTGLPLMLILAWFFLPVYISAGVYTLPEYIEKRFGGRRLRIYLSVLALVLYIVTKLAVSIFAGALFIQLALGWNMYLSIVALLVVTGVYTILGGLAAVMYTDTMQTVVMAIGSVILAGISFSKIGGFEGLTKKYMEAIPYIRKTNSTCGNPRDDSFHIFRDPVNGDNPWPGLILHTVFGCMWYFCCDQVIVQRSFAAKNISHAKGGSIVAGYFKLLPLFVIIFPGMISRALYPNEVGCVDPRECMKYCENPVGCSNIAYPKLVLELLPAGLRGLLLAVMLSAIMSSLTSIFNSASTIFTMDLWRQVRRRATERELLIVGRIFIMGICAVSILWIPLVRSSQGGQLFNYIQAMQGYLGTPIGPVFVLGIFWKRMNEKGAFWGLAVGQFCGIIRMGIDFAYPAPHCGEPETRPGILRNVHYTYFGVLLMIITSATIVIVSLATEAQEEESIKGLTWWTRIRAKDFLNNDNTHANDKDDGSQKNGLRVDDQDDESLDQSQQSICRRGCDIICGMRDADDQQSQRHLEEDQIKSYLQENPKWKTLINISAGVGLFVMAFLFGFFH